MSGFRQYAGLPETPQSPAASPQSYGDFLMQIMPKVLQRAQQIQAPPAPPDPMLQSGNHPGSPMGLPPAPMGQLPPPAPMPQAPMPQASMAPPPRMAPQGPPQAVSSDPNYQRGIFLQMMREGAQRG